MLRLTSILVLAGALAACATVASTVAFPAADANDDDLISNAEFREFFDDTDAFERFDDNDDGVLSRTEYNETVDNEYEGDAYFKGLDRDSNGSLTKDEFINGWFRMFDVDQNGFLSQREFRNAIEALEVEL